MYFLPFFNISEVIRMLAKVHKRETSNDRIQGDCCYGEGWATAVMVNAG